MQKTKGTFHKYPDDVGSVGTSHLPLARGKRQVWRSSLRDGRRASDWGDDWVPRPAARPGEAKAGPATKVAADAVLVQPPVASFLPGRAGISRPRVGKAVAGLSGPALSRSSVPLFQAPHGDAHPGWSSEGKGSHRHPPLSGEGVTLGPDGTAGRGSEATRGVAGRCWPPPPRPTLPGPCSSGPAARNFRNNPQECSFQLRLAARDIIGIWEK